MGALEGRGLAHLATACRVCGGPVQPLLFERLVDGFWIGKCQQHVQLVARVAEADDVGSVDAYAVEGDGIRILPTTIAARQVLGEEYVVGPKVMVDLP